MNAEFTLQCIKTTLAKYNPETSTHEEMVECWIRCSRAITGYFNPCEIDPADMTGHIVAMEELDKPNP